MDETHFECTDVKSLVRQWSPTLRITMWLETDDGILMGMGKGLLLRKVKELGSLRKAALELGISYRAAWGKIKAAEERLGSSLVCQSGGKWRGYSLTPLGEELLDTYEAFFADVEAYAVERARSCFGEEVKPFQENAPGAPRKKGKGSGGTKK